MKIYTIYKATNIINKKVYIGFDSNWPKRMYNHNRDAFNINTKTYNTVFHRAIRKYGKDIFSWEVLYQSKDREHTLKEMERYFIKEFKSFIYYKNFNGYNMTLGGDGIGGNKCSKERKRKISEKLKGNKNGLGNKISKETITKKLEKYTKEYEFIDPEGNYIKTKYLSKFCEQNNLNVCCMRKVGNGKQKEHNEYKNVNYFNSKKENSKIYRFLDKEYNLIELNEEKFINFCKENGLKIFMMKRLCDSKTNSYKEYKNLKYINNYYYEFLFNGSLLKFNFVELVRYCKEYNLNFFTMMKVFRGKRKSYKNYFNINHTVSVPKSGKGKKYSFISPEGDIINIFSSELDKFCKDNNLNKRIMYDLHLGKRNYHKEFKRVDNKEYSSRNERMYKFLNPNNEIVEIPQQKFSLFCRENGLNYKLMNAVYNGVRKHHRKWIKYIN